MVFNLKAIAPNIKLQTGIPPHVHDSRNSHAPRPLRDFQAGAVQGHDDRSDDEARYDGFRDTIDGRDAQHDVDDIHEGNTLRFSIGDADDGRKGPEEENRMADRRQDCRNGNTPYFADFQMTIDFKSNDADEDARYDTDEGIGNDVILNGEQEQGTWRL